MSGNDNTPHRRYNPLLGEWILCSPHRATRPWKGQEETPATDHPPAYDPHCYLCPGNTRVGGERNPQYTNTFIFDNDFQAILPPSLAETSGNDHNTSEGENEDDLFMRMDVAGTCRVVCFTPLHNLTLAQMDSAQIETVIEKWTVQYKELMELPYVEYVQIFENKGATMGCSNPHPHGQIWSCSTIPQMVEQELRNSAAYYQLHNQHLLVEYAAKETLKRERMVCENANFIAVVPYWAVWPFETLVLPRRHIPSLVDLSSQEKSDLADIIRRLTCRYDNLFSVSFPYSMGLHQAPKSKKRLDGGAEKIDYAAVAQLHFHFFPPLLRSATVRKFMVGYELMAEAQRDITAESAAARLRELSETHFLNTSRT